MVSYLQIILRPVYFTIPLITIHFPTHRLQNFRTTLTVESACIIRWLFTCRGLVESLNRRTFGAKESLLTPVSLRHIKFIISRGPIQFTRARILLCGYEWHLCGDDEITFATIYKPYYTNVRKLMFEMLSSFSTCVGPWDSDLPSFLYRQNLMLNFNDFCLKSKNSLL